MSNPDLIQALLDAIDAGDDERTEMVALSCTDQVALVPAIKPLLADQDSDRRWWAVRTLTLIGGQDVVSLLVERLTDDDEPVRCAAALALGSLRATDAVPTLAMRLADPSGWVRDSAADALALIGMPAVPALVESLQGRPDGVRVRAASALRRVVIHEGRPRATIDIQSLLGSALGALFRALNDPNYLVHQHAYEALNTLGLLDNLIVI